MQKKTKKAAGIAAGIAAAGAAVAAGYYFYGHKNAKKHRAAAERWVKDFKRDVIWETRQLQTITEKDFDRIVENVSRTYEGMKSVDLAALAEVASELKNNWRLVKEEVSKVRSTRVRTPAKRKTARKTRTAKKKKAA